jgi:hypothetical protein
MRARRARIACACACIAAACGGSSEKPPATGGSFTLQVGPGGQPGVDDLGKCPFATAHVAGSAGWNVYDGDAFDGGVAVHVSCSVSGGDVAYDVAASVAIGDATKLDLVGSVAPGGQGTATVTMVVLGDGFTSAAPCTLDSTREADGVGPGHLDVGVVCPAAGDAHGHVCEASARLTLTGCR